METITNLARILIIFKMATPHMAKIKEEQTIYRPTIKETANLDLNKVKLEATETTATIIIE